MAVSGDNLEERRQAWRTWVQARHWGSRSEAVREQAVDAAMAAHDRGASPVGAALAATAAARAWGPGDAATLGAEHQRLSVALVELAGIDPSGALTAEALDQLRAQLRRRREFLEDLAVEVRGGTARTPTPSTVGQPAGPTTAAEPRPAPPRPSMQEFLSDNGILVLSYIGAFLLIVATVLFEVYGTTGSDGGLRLAAVLALNAAFAAAGTVCLRRPPLRFVGHSYVAVAALMTPLSVLAAYVFVLRAFGLAPEVAVLAAATGCTLIYGALAVGLGSRAYAWLSMGAVAVAGVALVQADHAGTWSGFQLTVVPVVYAAVAAYRGDARFRELFGQAAAIRLHTSAAVAAGAAVFAASGLETTAAAGLLTATLAVLSLVYLVHAVDRRRSWAMTLALAGAGLCWVGLLNIADLRAWQGPLVAAGAAAFTVLARWPGGFARLRLPVPALPEALVHGAVVAGLAGSLAFDPGASDPWPLTATLAVVTGAYLGWSVLLRPAQAWLVGVGVTVTALSLGRAESLDAAGYAGALTVLAAGYLAAGWLTGARGRLRDFYRFGAAAQAVAAAAMPVDADWVRAVVALAGTGLLAAIAYDSRRALWLYPAGLLFAWDWYWLVKVLVPPPPNPGTDTLLTVYSPLPVLYGAGALLARRGRARAWAEPVLLLGGAGAVAVVMGVFGLQDWNLLAADLLVYALALYAAGLVEDLDWLFAVSAVSAAGGLAALMRAREEPGWSFVLALTGVAWVTYIAGVYWRSAGHPRWARAHSSAAVYGDALVVLATFTVAGFYDPGDPGALAAAGAALSLALMLYAEGRGASRPILEHAGLVIAPVAAFWLSRYAGFTNGEAYALFGTGLLAAGVAIPHDRRLQAVGGWAPWLAAAGLLVILGTTVLLSLDTDSVAVGYAALLALESVAACVLGVGLRNRALVVGGGTGVVAASLRALVILSHQYPLWVVFGVVALVLLGVSAVLAVLRERFGNLRSTVATSWSTWS